MTINNFAIEQIALAAEDIDKAITDYQRAGHGEWSLDLVTMKTKMYDLDGIRSSETIEGITVAHLAFNYTLIPGKEFELISFQAGQNFHQDRGIQSGAMSHMGMHIPDDMSLDGFWRGLPQAAKGRTLMEAWTISHTGKPAENGKRYRYLILDTQRTLGFYLKLIQRIQPS